MYNELLESDLREANLLIMLDSLKETNNEIILFLLSLRKNKKEKTCEYLYGDTIFGILESDKFIINSFGCYYILEKYISIRYEVEFDTRIYKDKILSSDIIKRYLSIIISADITKIRFERMLMTSNLNNETKQQMKKFNK